MRFLLQLILLTLLSIALHSGVQLLSARWMSFESLQRNTHWFVILTMAGFIVLAYILLRRWNDRTKPKFLRGLLLIFIVQVISIVSLSVIRIISAFAALDPNLAPDTAALSMGFDPSDLLIKVVLFALGLPLLLLGVIYFLDGRGKRRLRTGE